jgi:hypothetical protein
MLLIAAAGTAIGGSFENLDRAIDTQPGGVVQQTILTSPWYYRTFGNVPGTQPVDLGQFFGIALAVGGMLAILCGVLLLLGQGGRLTAVRSLGAAAAALLFGAVLATEMSVVNDIQWDALAPSGEHSTAFGPGFWLLFVAGLATVAAGALLLIYPRRGPRRAARGEPPTPAYGLPAFTARPVGEPPQPVA